MPDKVSPGPLRGNPVPKEAVCIHTKKVYDSCRDKECLQEMRVCLTRTSQAVFEGAVNVKARNAELLWAYIDVESIPFNKGFFTVDVTYYYKITADAYFGSGRPREICGLAVYDKRTILFGSEGSVRIFSSQYRPQAGDVQCFERSNLPIAVVEVVDPVLLGIKVYEGESCEETFGGEIPECIRGCFDDDVLVCSNDDGVKKMYANLGQFSIIKLERDIQLLMPAYDICMPEKECDAGSNVTDDPCAMFQQFKFPVDEFFPPRVTQVATTAANPTQFASNGCGCRRR